MARNERSEAIYLQESLPPNPDGPEPPSMDGVENSESRFSKSNRTYAGVLLGSSISQLPIWGFFLSYGIFQEYYFNNWTLQGNRSLTGVIGNTQAGVMYLSMPFMFALFTKRYARYRQLAALCGAVLAAASFILSSFSKHVWHLVATQGVMAALGCALIYSPITLSLGEWFNTKNRICNRAVAYGISLSSKNIVGSACPFMIQALLDRCGFRTTLRAWAVITFGSAILSILMIPTPSSSTSASIHRARKIPWLFLRHPTFYIYIIATLLQSTGYGLPTTYLSDYGRNIAQLSSTYAALLLTLTSIPGIASSSLFSFLSDNKYIRLSTPTVSAISAVTSALSTLFLWGFAGRDSLPLLILYAICYGFFANGYSGTWGGMINEMEREAAQKNEAIDPGLLYGLLNGARGIGFVTGGLSSVLLIQAGSTGPVGRFGYGTTYGPLILFTGLTLAFGGWGLMWKWMKVLRF